MYLVAASAVGRPVEVHAYADGSAFKDWVLLAAMERVWRKLNSADDGNRRKRQLALQEPGCRGGHEVILRAT
jgi:hypothetical protein